MEPEVEQPYVPMASLDMDAPKEPTEGQEASSAVEDKPQEEVVKEEPQDEEERISKSKRVQELIHRRKEAELAAERERAERERLEERLRALEKPEKPKAVGAPSLNDFETVEEWQSAFTEWQTDQILTAVEKKQQKAREEEAKKTEEKRAQEAFSAYDRAEEAYKQKLGDEGARAFDEATTRLKPFVADNPILLRALITSSPETVHALAENLELAEKLSGADPLTIGMEIGRLAQSVGDKGRQGRKFSAAPTPEPTVGGLKSGALPRSYENLSGDEYARVRDQEEAERRKTQYVGRW